MRYFAMTIRPHFQRNSDNRNVNYLIYSYHLQKTGVHLLKTAKLKKTTYFVKIFSFQPHFNFIKTTNIQIKSENKTSIPYRDTHLYSEICQIHTQHQSRPSWDNYNMKTYSILIEN